MSIENKRLSNLELSNSDHKRGDKDKKAFKPFEAKKYNNNKYDSFKALDDRSKDTSEDNLSKNMFTTS